MTREDLPPVKECLSGLRATLRDTRDNVMVIQNNIGDHLYFRINGEAIIVPTNQFIGVLNRLIDNKKKGEI